MGFVVDSVALGQISFEYFGFPCQFSFRQMLHIHLPPRAGTVGQLVADVSSGLSLTPPQETKKKKKSVSSVPEPSTGHDPKPVPSTFHPHKLSSHDPL
jgi:hypothetical protein